MLQPLKGFQSLQTHHCVTGSLRHVYLFNHHDLSEDMLLGIGSGVSFCYWHFKGQPPFLGGRGNAGAPGQGRLEVVAGRRTGVVIQPHRTSSANKAEKALLEMLAAGQPLMVTLDMGYLPYFDFQGQEYHFGAHAVVICGYESASGGVLVADRDGLHPVSMEALARARGSKHRPFPPQNEWYTFDFSGKRLPSPQEVRQAIREQAAAMLAPPIRNLGLKGIHKAAEAVPLWGETMNEKELRWALFNAYIFISPVGGSGGGIFRYMFSRFLHEAAAITGDPHLDKCAIAFNTIADRWQDLAEWFHQTSKALHPASHLKECTTPLLEIAALEESTWSRL